MLLVLLAAFLFGQAHAGNWNDTWSRYHKSKPHGLTVVSVNMHVLAINRIDSHDGLIQMTMIFRQEWKDHRLAHTAQRHYVPQYQTVERGEIWVPDTFFAGEIDAYPHTLLEDNSMLRVFPSGDILLSRKITLTLKCPMDLSNFPFDTQVCNLSVASYAHTRNLIDYHWNTSQPIQGLRETAIPEFELTQYNTDQCHQRTLTGEYSCIQVDFTLKRNWRYYLVQVFIPMTSLILLAWFSFWIRQSTVRVLILMFALSLAIFGVTTVNTTLPHTNYVKMIDIFTGTGLTFIFAAIAIFVIVSRRLPDDLEKEDSEDKIDITARVVYPACYAGFILVYSLSALLR